MIRKHNFIFPLIFIISFSFLLVNANDKTFFETPNSNEYEYKLNNVYRGNDFITDFNISKSETFVNGYDEMKIKVEDKKKYVYTTPRNTFILKSLRDVEDSSSYTNRIQIFSKNKWKSGLFALNVNEIVKGEKLKASLIFQKNDSTSKKIGCVINFESNSPVLTSSSLLQNNTEKSCKKNTTLNDSLNSFIFPECELFTHILIVDISSEAEASCRFWMFYPSQIPFDLLEEKPDPSRWTEKPTLIPIVEMESSDYGEVKCGGAAEKKEKKQIIREREEKEEIKKSNFMEDNKNKVESFSEENEMKAEKRKNEENDIGGGEGYSLVISLEFSKIDFSQDKEVTQFLFKNWKNEFLRCAVKHDCNVLKGKKNNRYTKKVNDENISYLEINYLKVYQKIKTEVGENHNNEYSYFDNSNTDKLLVKNKVKHDVTNSHFKNSSKFLDLTTMRSIKARNRKKRNGNYDSFNNNNDIFQKPCEEKKNKNCNVMNDYKERGSEGDEKETYDKTMEKMLREIFVDENTRLLDNNKGCNNNKNCIINSIKNNEIKKKKKIKKIIIFALLLFSLLKKHNLKNDIMASGALSEQQEGETQNEEMLKSISQEKEEEAKKARRLDVAPLTVRTINTIGNTLAKGFENRMELHQLLQADVQAKKNNVRHAAGNILRIVGSDIPPAFIPLQNAANTHNYLLAQNSFAPAAAAAPNYVASSVLPATQRPPAPFAPQALMGAVNPFLHDPNFSSVMQPMLSSPPLAFRYYPGSEMMMLPNNHPNNNNNIISGSDNNGSYKSNILVSEPQVPTALMQNYLQNGRNFNRFVNERVDLIESGKQNVEVAGETLLELVKNYGGVLTDKKAATPHENIISQHTDPSLFSPSLINNTPEINNLPNYNNKKNVPYNNHVRNRYGTDLFEARNNQERSQNYIMETQHLSEAPHFALQENIKNFENIASTNSFPLFYNNNNNALQNSTLPYSNFSHYNSQMINNNRFLHKNSSNLPN